ncbi:phosphoenolpyruvate carboxykinase (ATP) [Desulfovibrio gilichinskyi]|uniref:Phosphoenolpyruvate carboxykinase (ATP) n=1 Tax=Desulfovibrio gilichinskyi TaxID=1519643 RepID=A0A1X7CS92_9BACT|nr:phosphoenolpyruvate carboxykinase (ATP) [Desulfovibrio gilichinskyi]SMF02167.1 phosphoenolpyruvate carboxykinase (ATP) [Desulfovibrio gilichinskyi]
MASQSTYEFYKEDLSKIPPLRAIAETLVNDKRVRKVNAAEAYLLAKTQWDVMDTDQEIYPEAAKRLGLPKGATVLNNCQGKIVGRTGQARRFYSKLNGPDQRKVLGDLREAISDMQKRPLIKAEAIIGLDKDLMIRATIVGGEDDAANIFNWLVNFTPYEELAAEYEKSAKLPIQDIIIIGDNVWRNDDPFYHNQGFPQLALVDEECNVIYNFGMRYFGERKKGTLTLAWTSGIRVGMAACHGGIKELDFSKCADENAKKIGQRSIAFFGLSGTGKSSHTNSHDNGGTLPEGFAKKVLHDDAFQIDIKNRVCRAWEPTLFDKTDSRPLGHPDWKYMVSVMNHATINVDGKILPLGQDLRNPNGRALIDRDVLGNYVNRCKFPEVLCWLMKDTCLPPIIRFTDTYLAVAMGAALMTKRNLAENVSEEELKKLVFVPYANPFRVYELWKDVEAFANVFENGATGYSFNSVGFWKSSDVNLHAIPLKTSLTLQSLILLDKLEWEDWSLLPGAQLPKRNCIEKILPGFYDTYNPQNTDNQSEYIQTLKDRFAQRRHFLEETEDLNCKPEILAKLTKVLRIKE